MRRIAHFCATKLCEGRSIEEDMHHAGTAFDSTNASLSDNTHGTVASWDAIKQQRSGPRFYGSCQQLQILQANYESDKVFGKIWIPVYIETVTEIEVWRTVRNARCDRS